VTRPVAEPTGPSQPTHTARDLLAVGFVDLERVRRFLDAPELAGIDRTTLLDGLRQAADPDQALMCLVRLLSRAPALARLAGDRGAHRGLFRLLGASEALSDFLTRHPEHTDLLSVPRAAEFDPAPHGVWRDTLLRSVGADPADPTPVAHGTGKDVTKALRVAYRAAITDVALRDVCAADPTECVGQVAAELSDLAGAALEGALAVARAELAGAHPGLDPRAVRLAVIGMGKCGARELNYISDVDVIWVHDVADTAEEAVREQSATLAAELARRTSHTIMAPGAEPALWEVDANLRPEGKDGALSRTVESHVTYLNRWAHDWEFQALLKARTIAGDQDLGREYEQAVAPLIWSSSERKGFVEGVQRMRARVTENIAAEQVPWQLKLGPGGLRDVEFTVQLLQLVHGRVEPRLRVRGTLPALHELGETAYISRADALSFASDYRFLRTLEHRIQLVRMRRSHLVPESEAEQRVLSRSMAGGPDLAQFTAGRLMTAWKRVKASVRGLHQKLFFRPLLATAARLGVDEVKLSSDAAQARLSALGYASPKQAMAHIEALTAGVSRSAALQRQLLPVLLGWMADSVDPDAALLGFRRLAESLGGSPWFLAMLRDSPAGAERLCHILGTSRMVSDLLEVSPESTAWLGNDAELTPTRWEKLWGEIESKLRRHVHDPDGGMRLVRLTRRREQLRTALADGSGLVDVLGVGAALSDVDRATVIGALRVAENRDYAEHGESTRLLVVAMGRQGGREIGYGSDADVLFVHQPGANAEPAAAQAQAERLAQAVGALLRSPLKPPVLAERRLELDADLRPEGKQGPLVRTLESYREYYERWAEVWERQALLRAMPMAGDPRVARDFIEVIDPVRYDRGLTATELMNIRRIKARVEGERLPRGADPKRHLKLGPGGLSDVEWLVQTMQLQHAGRYPQLRLTSTVPALRELAAVGLIEQDDAQGLEDAWMLATDLRAAVVACTGRAANGLPENRQDLGAIASWTERHVDDPAELEEEWLRTARHARNIFERLFYPV
jgi:glutamate-ammonia-ligase adenylyltransferase